MIAMMKNAKMNKNSLPPSEIELFQGDDKKAPKAPQDKIRHQTPRKKVTHYPTERLQQEQNRCFLLFL